MRGFGFCLEVKGDFACFTRPELKVERMSYDVITPSAARAIYSCILWKPRIAWVIERVDVLAPIRFISIRRNEVGAIAKKKSCATTLMLRDVRYRIYAHFDFIHKPGETLPSDETPQKYVEMFTRRAEKGQCFRRPYLGCRECAAFFKFIPDPDAEADRPIPETRDLGLMLYDMDYTNPEDIQPIFFHAFMKNGVIEIPHPNSKELLR